jgi:CHAT domain-containing protein
LPETSALYSTENLGKSEFSKQFFEAFSRGSEPKELQELVGRAEFSVFAVVMEYSRKGIELIAAAEGKSAATYLYIAGMMAKYYAKEFGRDRLFKLVLKYSRYDQKMAIKRLDAVEFRAEGLSFYNAKKSEAAAKKWKRALQFYREIDDDAGISIVLNDLAYSLSSQNRYEEAIEYSSRSHLLSNDLGNWKSEASSLKNIAISHHNLARYAPALDHYQKALSIYIRSGTREMESEVLMNIGNTYLALRQVKKAILHYKKCAALFKESGQQDMEANCLMNLGTANIGRNRLDAVKAFSASLDIFRLTGNREKEASVLLNMGSLYMLLDDYNRARDNYQSSLQVFRSIGNVRDELTALVNISAIAMKKGNFAESLQISNDAIRVARRIGYREALWRLYVRLAETLWKSGRPEEAVEHYQSAIEVIEELYAWTEGLKEKERSSMIGEKSFVFQEFIELLLELYKKHPGKGFDKQAFIISEKAKSRTFQELMAKSGARTAFAGDDAFKKLTEKEQQFISRVTHLRQSLIIEKSKPEKQRNEELVASFKEQLSKAEKSLKDLEKEIENKYPRYVDLKRPKPLTVGELQKTLKPDETVLAYSVGKEKTVAFVIGKKSFKLIEISAGKKELSELIKKFRKGIDNVYDLKDLEKFKPETAYRLYQKIFEPVTSELKGKSKIYISADDILYTLPFEALVEKGIDLQAFRDARKKGRKGIGDYLGEYNSLHYLIDSYTITYLPSASVLRSLRKYEKPGYGKWDKSLIAFADPVFSDEEEKGESKEVEGKGIKSKGVSKETELTFDILTRSTGSDKLQRLKESGQEAKAIAKALKGKEKDIYLRKKATEENIFSADLKRARYLLFSTHGLLGGDFSGVAEPSLALTLIDNPPGKDGFLSMSEVLGLDLNAEMIILSACNTYGKGEKAGSGEGFAGLARSFMYAGSKTLLVTHWSVESQAARDLMVKTFEQMKKENRPDALRNAKLDMKKSSRPLKDNSNVKLSLSHPFFWAPFVLVGEGR